MNFRKHEKVGINKDWTGDNIICFIDRILKCAIEHFYSGYPQTRILAKTVRAKVKFGGSIMLPPQTTCTSHPHLHGVLHCQVQVMLRCCHPPLLRKIFSLFRRGGH